MIFLVYGDFNWGDPDAASCNPQSPTHPPTALLRAIGREAHRTICYGIGCGDGPHVLIQRREGPKNFCGAVASIIAPFRQKNGCKISWKRDGVKGEATQFLESTLVLRGEHMITCYEEERTGVESTEGSETNNFCQKRVASLAPVFVSWQKGQQQQGQLWDRTAFARKLSCIPRKRSPRQINKHKL